MENPLEFYTHIYLPPTNSGGTTFILLHDKGGTERDLISIAQVVKPGAGILSLRGNVLQDNQHSFYYKQSNSRVDESDLFIRTRQFADFLNQATLHYSFSKDRIVILAYANGADMVAEALMLIQRIAHFVILLRPILTIVPEHISDMADTSLFVSAGIHDPLSPPDFTRRLIDVFMKAGARTTLNWANAGRELIADDTTAIKRWFMFNVGG